MHEVGLVMNFALRSRNASWLDLLTTLDRQWSERLRSMNQAPAIVQRCWIGVTHAGGTTSTVLAVTLPALVPTLAPAAANAAIGLVTSHLLVQLLKRTMVRARPEAAGACVALPDRYSFPSGHATAAMVVALGWGLAFPVLFVPLLLLGLLIGLSRVVLGVHHLGDVLAGQGIALVTALALAGVR